MPDWSNTKYRLAPRKAPSVDTMRILDRMLRNGSSDDYAAKETGLTPLKVKRYRRVMMGLPKFCGCGERWNAPHSCWWKVNSALGDGNALDQLRQLRRAKLALKGTLDVIKRVRSAGGVVVDHGNTAIAPKCRES